MATKDDPLNKKIGVNMTPTEIELFVKKLAEDDDFRSELQKRPVETLQKYGIRVAADQVFPKVILPSKSDLQRALRTIQENGEEDIVFHLGFLGLVFKPSRPPRPK